MTTAGAAPAIGEEIVVNRKESGPTRGVVTRVIGVMAMATARPMPASIEIDGEVRVHVKQDADGSWWDAHESTERKRAVERAWDALVEAGAFRHGRMARLGTWLVNNYGVTHPHFLTEEEADFAERDLSRWLRRIGGKQAETAA